MMLTGLTTPALAAGTDASPSLSTSVDSEESVINTAPPAEPEEDVTDVPEESVSQEPTDPGNPDGETLPTQKPSDSPAAEYCGPTRGVYRATSKGGNKHKGVGPTLSNYNNTSRTAESRFESEMTGEVGVAVSAGLKVSASAMVAEIEGTYNVDLSMKITAKMGVSVRVDTPPRKTTNAKFGVFRLKNTGKSYTQYSNCSTSEKKTITSYSPIKVGWYLWES